MRSKSTAPAAILEALAELQNERRVAGARVDALELAIDNLQRAYGLNGHAAPASATSRGRGKAKRNGAIRDDVQLEALVGLIAKSDVGLTLAELRQATPKMRGAERSKLLQAAKHVGRIKRAGNAWRVA